MGSTLKTLQPTVVTCCNCGCRMEVKVRMTWHSPKKATGRMRPLDAVGLQLFTSAHRGPFQARTV